MNNIDHVATETLDPGFHVDDTGHETPLQTKQTPPYHWRILITLVPRQDGACCRTTKTPSQLPEERDKEWPQNFLEPTLVEHPWEMPIHGFHLGVLLL